MDLIVILPTGVASGTVLLFATVGEIFSERSGILNLGVEGMMLVGAMSAFSVALATGSPWLGVLVAMLVAGLLSQIHAFITVTLQADQVVSGLAITFLGAGISVVLGEGLSKVSGVIAASVFNSYLIANTNTGTNLLHSSEHYGVYRLLTDTTGMVLHQQNTSWFAPASGG